MLLKTKVYKRKSISIFKYSNGISIGSGRGTKMLTTNAETIAKEASISFTGDKVVINGFNDSYGWGLKFEDNRDTQNGVTGLKMKDQIELSATNPDFITSEPVEATIAIHYYEYGAYYSDNNEMYIRCSTVANQFWGDSFSKISSPSEMGLQTLTYTVDNALLNHNINF